VKIALLHYSAWPEVGGVENVMRDQANMLVNAGHDVTVLAGDGLDRKEGYTFALVPELARDFPLNKSVRDVLDRGQADKNFSQYRSLLVETLHQLLDGFDVTFIHNAFTVHRNLAITCALHDLAPQHRFVAWTHDLTASCKDSSLPNPTRPPWNLMRISSPHVTYVATSALRAKELKAHLKPPVEPIVIPNMADPVRVYGLSTEIRRALLSLEIPWRDFVFLLPAKILVRKNIDFALEVTRGLCEQGRNPLLLITGGKVEDNPALEHYGKFLRQSLPPTLQSHVLFLSDYFVVWEDILRDLFLLSDCIFYPSRQEGFGLPVLEAAMHRLPVWCQDIPAYRDLEGGGTFLLDDLAKLADAVEWLEAQPAFRQQRRCRRLFDPSIVYINHYEKLLNTFTASKTS
jgi:glycosyltransferase involved in cell wall biosynthesis